MYDSGGTKRGLGFHWNKISVEICNGCGQAVHMPRHKLAARSQLVQLIGNRETPHPQRIFHSWQRTELWCFRRAADGNNIEIYLRRQPPVKADFFLTVKVARCQAGEIQKA